MAEITRVRWGGVSHSLNGIPTGTTYTLVFGDARSEAIVTLRRKDVYSAFIEKAWRAVGARLVAEMAATLKRGEKLGFADAVVTDSGVSLKRHQWMRPSERVHCKWGETHIWSADGSFCIGARNDKKVSVAISYINVENAHILEQLIRVAFKKGIQNLSDVLGAE